MKKEKEKKAKAEASEKKKSEVSSLKDQPKMKFERRRKGTIRSRRRAQAKMAARTLLSEWGSSEESGNLYLRPAIR